MHLWKSSTAQLIEALIATPWVDLVGGTLVVTLLAAAIAIGLPPLLLLTLRWRRLRQPLWALLADPRPSHSPVAAADDSPQRRACGVALGLHHSGVMGRVMEEDLHNVGSQQFEAIRQSGPVIPPLCFTANWGRSVALIWPMDWCVLT